MIFKQTKPISKFGENLGFIFSYFLFTTIFYFILIFLSKLPESWSYVHVMMLTLSITIIGIILKRVLK